jgi:hypothetical protein
MSVCVCVRERECVCVNIFALNDACEGLFVCLWDGIPIFSSSTQRDKKLDHFREKKEMLKCAQILFQIYSTKSVTFRIVLTTNNILKFFRPGRVNMRPAGSRPSQYIKRTKNLTFWGNTD